MSILLDQMPNSLPGVMSALDQGNLKRDFSHILSIDFVEVCSPFTNRSLLLALLIPFSVYPWEKTHQLILFLFIVYLYLWPDYTVNIHSFHFSSVSQAWSCLKVLLHQKHTFACMINDCSTKLGMIMPQKYQFAILGTGNGKWTNLYIVWLLVLNWLMVILNFECLYSIDS